MGRPAGQRRRTDHHLSTTAQVTAAGPPQFPHKQTVRGTVVLWAWRRGIIKRRHTAATGTGKTRIITSERRHQTAPTKRAADRTRTGVLGNH